MLKLPKKFKKPLLVGIATLVLLAGLLAIFKKLPFLSYPQKVAVIPVSKTNNEPQTQQNSTGQSTDKNPATTPTQSGNNQQGSVSGSGPQQPYGTFVSNHRPSLSGSSSPSSEQSICSGTPGAKCYVSFTKDSVTKNLPDQIIGIDGSTFWNWDVKSAGLSVGSWTIKAVSTLNGKTAEATDSLKLEVQP